MTGPVRGPAQVDPGAAADRPDRARRLLAGGSAATGSLCAGLAALSGGGEALPLLLAVLVAGTACTAAAPLLGLGRPGRARLGGAALLGGVTAAGAALLLGALDGGTEGVVDGRPDGGPADGPGGALDGVVVLVLAVAVPLGVLGGLLAAAVARWAPRRALVPVAALGLLATAASLATAHLAQRPAHPGSYLVVSGPTSASTALPLARAVADRLRAEPDPLSDAAWSRVAGQVVRTRGGGSVSVGYAAPPAQRRITVDVEGDLACVVVTATGARARSGPCAG